MDPQGIVAILVDSKGREVSTATDFNAGAPGGFLQREAQTIRVKGHLAMRAVRDLASPLLSNAVTQHDADRILRQMCEQGCRVVIVPIGYNEDQL